MKQKAKLLFYYWENETEPVFLFGKRRAGKDEFWWIPGGSVEAGEDHFEAALRELHEELEPVSFMTEVLNEFKRKSTWPPSIQFTSSNAETIVFMIELGSQINKSLVPSIKEEFEEMKWFGYKELPPNMSREFERIAPAITPHKIKSLSKSD